MKNNRFTTSLCAALLLGLTQAPAAYADTNTTQTPATQQSANNEQQVKTFYLNLWAPDQVADADAKPAEYGANYQYSYTPNSHEVESGDREQLVEFKFHPSVKHRYKFRWLSADQPQLVSFSKIKPKKMKVTVDTAPNSTTEDTDVYFEVWVLDTETGEVFMCDPKVRIVV